MRPASLLRFPAPALLALALLVSGGAPRAVERDVYREMRGRYEGLVLRLKIDLKTAATATPPNTVSLDGVGYARENAPVLFGRLERVYLERVTNDGKSRLELTVYRSQEDATRTRANAIPQPMGSNPLAGRTLAMFAQQDSTSVLLEVKAGKQDPAQQTQEIEALMDRIFYVKSEPSIEEMEEFVRTHGGMPMSRLRALTGLPPERIRALLEEGRVTPPPRP